MYRTDDPVADAARYDFEAAQWLRKRPRCGICGDRIQDDRAFRIYLPGTDDFLLCPQCLETNMVWIDDEGRWE